MSPETPSPPDRDPEQGKWDDDRFGPEAQASVDRSLQTLVEPDDALRLLALVKENGAGFAAYLLLPDTNIAAVNLEEAFHDAYVDAWETFAEFRRDVLDGLGWLVAVKNVMNEQGIPDDHLRWNHAVVDERIAATYDAIRLDGWWHIFYK
ncbi:hypothetical protein AB0O16_07535 [Microbacterium sp. NPDC089180]|uniref:hypothetical protein n=1 Tax=unclassified Microbacterium TaxID=2609290 RepID=UPI003433ECF9